MVAEGRASGKVETSFSIVLSVSVDGSSHLEYLELELTVGVTFGGRDVA